MAAAFTIWILYARLVFSSGATTTITDDQGIDNLDKTNLSYNNDSENLCKYILCPGGTIVGHGVVEIPNLGIAVSLQAGMNLTLTTYYLWQVYNISRTIDAGNVTLRVVRLIGSLKERQEDHEKLATAPKSNDKDMVKTFNNIVEFLCLYPVESKIPLS